MWNDAPAERPSNDHADPPFTVDRARAHAPTMHPQTVAADAIDITGRLAITRSSEVSRITKTDEQCNRTGDTAGVGPICRAETLHVWQVTTCPAGPDIS